MKFWKRKQDVRADSEEKTQQGSINDLIQSLLGPDSMTRDKVMQIATVAGCINLITGIVSSLDINLYKQDGDKTKKITDDDRTFVLNTDTGDKLTPNQFWRAIIEDYYLDKGGYAYIRKSNGNIKGLHYIKPSYVSLIKNYDPIFKDYNIMIDGKSYYQFEVFKLLRKTTDGCESVPIVKENELQFAIAYNSMLFENNLVKKGGNKKGFLESQKKLAKEAMDTLKEGFRKLYGNNTENVVVLNDGVTFKESSNTSVEMQLNENKETNAKEICKIFNVPIGMLNGTASGVEIDNFIKFCLVPLLDDIETSLNRDLLREDEKRSFSFAYDTRQLTRASIKERYEAYALALKNHFLQTDELTDMEHMAALGIDWIELGLDSVLYNPKTKTVYTPNTNATTNIEGGENIDENRNTVRPGDDN